MSEAIIKDTASETNKTDATFFTNEEGSSLLNRFKRTLADTKYFDVLVGYFRVSGFYQLHDSIEGLEKTRILIGLGIDETAYQNIKNYQHQATADFESQASIKIQFEAQILQEIEHTNEPDQQLETGLLKFIEFLQTDCKDKTTDLQNNNNGKKLEFRAFPSRNLHAKVYISRYKDDDRDYGSVITGSSNFSYSGLVANREFNVQLKDSKDVKFALDQFESLWENSVDISEDFVQTVQQKSWLNDTITPYELYLKLIYEYLEEDINLEALFNPFLPEGFMKLEYQQQAVRQAYKKLHEYNGVFLADVVGLGKTFIAAQLLQQLRGKILVICPPVLVQYWEESLMDFRVPAKVESLGKLDKLTNNAADEWDYVVIDEAHRFRNESTQRYADLLNICRGKKIILVTATPLNNKIEDIYAQLKLFQAPRNSSIPGVPNLEKFFKTLQKQFADLEKDTPEYREMITQVSDEIRNKILQYVMVRRTRRDVLTYFSNDIEQQNLFFPEVQDPQRIIYEFKGKTEQIFSRTIQILAQFRYARYTPLLYYAGNKQLTEFEKQQQRNVGGFMKGILVKRLESSFFAFRQSIGRFIVSYERFIQMYQSGTIYISRKVNVFDLLDKDDIEKLEKAVSEERANKYFAADFNGDYIRDLKHDLELLKNIRDLWKGVDQDPKLDQLQTELQNNPILQNQRLIIFTESKETGDYLYENLVQTFPKKVMFYSSKGGRHTNLKLTSKQHVAREIILNNYDPRAKKKAKDIRILITTDILAEGINLHRSNILINYDLPWNPTRVLQRAGRVNRLGTAHQQIFIFNFFPTTQADAHLGLETNITNKIQMFHDILGEDAKYLSEGEQVGSQELFDTLNSKKSYDDDQNEDSELRYLELMRNIRDNDPELFEKIKKLPKKARSGKHKPDATDDQLITFFRLGKLKKFYEYQTGKAREITFFDAVRQLKSEPEELRIHVSSETYFDMLTSNKARFELDSIQSEDETKLGGKTNIDYIEKRLKTKTFKAYKGFTDSDDEYLKTIKAMLQNGSIAKKTAQKIRNDIQKESEPPKILQVLRTHIKSTQTYESNSKAQTKKEVILSGYIKA